MDEWGGRGETVPSVTEPILWFAFNLPRTGISSAFYLPHEDINLLRKAINLLANEFVILLIIHLLFHVSGCTFLLKQRSILIYVLCHLFNPIYWALALFSNCSICSIYDKTLSRNKDLNLYYFYENTPLTN